MSSLIKGKFKKFPITLYRLQQSKEVKLRDLTSQSSKGRRSYDFVINDDGLIYPSTTENFIGPNGMSLRPIGKSLANISKSLKYSYVYEIPEGTEIPDDLILLHEYLDHYSLQTSVKCTPLDLNYRLNSFIMKQKSLTKEEYTKILINFKKNSKH